MVRGPRRDVSFGGCRRSAGRDRRRCRCADVAVGGVWTGERNSMIGKLKTVVFDAPDITALSAFYTALAGWTQRYADDEWVTLTTDDGWRIGLQHAPDHIPPRWPDPQHP